MSLNTIITQITNWRSLIPPVGPINIIEILVLQTLLHKFRNTVVLTVSSLYSVFSIFLWMRLEVLRI